MPFQKEGASGGLCREKVMVGKMGEIWFRPKARFHVSNARAATERDDGNDRYLDADGRMPPPVRPPELQRDLSQAEEDPPGVWATPS